eukprot:jgi/Tetstr1/438572/TSEL_027123.t1
MDELADPTERAWRSTKARQLWAQPPVGERLAENCGRGVALLFEVAYQHRALFTAAEEMNPRVLARCKALVFTFERQAGIGVKFSRGTGFVIRKQPTVDPGGMWSKVEWSPPIPLEIIGGGIGVTLGSNEYGTIYAVMSDGPLQGMQMRDEELRDQRPVLNLQGSFSITGLDLSNRRAAWSFDRAANHLVADKTPIDVVTFRLSNGMMLDMSVGTACMDIDMREVDAVYNGQRNIAELMEAELPEFAAPLYDAIDQVMKHELS